MVLELHSNDPKTQEKRMVTIQVWH